MNVSPVSLNSILSSLEADNQQDVEHETSDEVILNIQSLKRIIELTSFQPEVLKLCKRVIR